MATTIVRSKERLKENPPSQTLATRSKPDPPTQSSSPAEPAQSRSDLSMSVAELRDSICMNAVLLHKHWANDPLDYMMPPHTESFQVAIPLLPRGHNKMYEALLTGPDGSQRVLLRGGPSDSPKGALQNLFVASATELGQKMAVA